MSSYIELLNPQTMTGKLLQDGEVIAEYKIEQCDGCEKLVKFDKFGYREGIRREKLLWFCGDCR